MNKIIAKIVNAKSKKVTNSLWLLVSRDENKSIEDYFKTVLGITDRDEDNNSVAYAIQADEVLAIRDACNEYLANAKDV